MFTTIYTYSLCWIGNKNAWGTLWQYTVFYGPLWISYLLIIISICQSACTSNVVIIRTEATMVDQLYTFQFFTFLTYLFSAINRILLAADASNDYFIVIQEIFAHSGVRCL